MRAPDLAEVYAAELKFARAAQDTVDGVRRAQAAVRERLARPSTLAAVAGAAALSGFLLARRSKPKVPISGRRRVPKESGPSAASLMMAFILRQALARLSAILERLWMQRRQQGVAPAASVTPKPAPPKPAPVVRPGDRVLH